MLKNRLAAVLLVFALAGLAAPLEGMQLTVSYRVLERVLEKGLFRDQGRYYVSGSSDDDCNYAYLARPRLGVDGGRLALRLHFNGFAGAEVGGQCLGSGDEFDFVVTGVPKVEGGSLVLGDPQLSLSGRPAYEALLQPIVTGPLAQALRFDLAAELDHLVAGAAREGLRVRISGLEIFNPRATPGWLEVGVELSAALTEGAAP